MQARRLIAANPIRRLTIRTRSSVRGRVVLPAKSVVGHYHVCADDRRARTPMQWCRSISTSVSLQSGKVEIQEVAMPALSPTMTEGNITEWRLKEGDEMAPGEVLCSVETDKATVDFEIQDEAVLAKIIVPSGTQGVKVGTVIAYTVEDSEAYKAFKVEGGTSAPAYNSAPSPPSQSLAGNKEKESGAKAKIQFLGKRSTEKASPSEPASWMVDWSRGVSSETHRAASEDSARPMSHGKIAADDAPKDLPGASGSDRFTDVPANNIKKITAKRLTESKATVPHHYASVDVELDAIMRLRKQMKENGVNLSVNDFILKSVALALRDLPDVNRRWDDKQSEALANSSIDISVAVATERGLITPIVKNVDQKGLYSINNDFKDLVKRARDNKLKLDEFQGGSFSISNLGGFGIDSFSAVINPPQSCILAIGGGRKTVVPGRDSDGPPRTATLMTVQLSADVRVVDGALAGQFLQIFKAYGQP